MSVAWGWGPRLHRWVTQMKQRRIALVSCVTAKGGRATKAADLYRSPWFLEARRIAETSFDRWFILSAKHELLRPDKVIAPYDAFLGSKSQNERTEWASHVAADFQGAVTEPCAVYLFAGEDYRRFLAPKLRLLGHEVYEPLARLSIGRQLSWLKDSRRPETRLRDFFAFQDLLTQLRDNIGGVRLFSSVEAKHVPASGVYFFLDPQEGSTLWTPLPRLVRIGTHAVSTGSKATLWQRLRAHRGTGDGGGNHRASIFRLHVGRAMIERGDFQSESWGKGQVAGHSTIAAEVPIERAVSEYIRNLQVLTLAVGDLPGPMSDRAYIEQCSIALVSGRRVPVVSAGKGWLGSWSDRATIQTSGLWNVNHVFGGYDARFLLTFEKLLAGQAGAGIPSESSLVPADWRNALANSHRSDDQLPLL